MCVCLCVCMCLCLYMCLFNSPVCCTFPKFVTRWVVCFLLSVNLGRPTVSYPYICARDKINMSCHKMARKRMISCSCRVVVSVCANRQAGRVWPSAQVRCFCCPAVGVQHLYGLKQWRRMNGRIISICLNYTPTVCNFHCTSHIYKLLDNNLVLRGSTPPLTVARSALLQQRSQRTGISTALRVTSWQMIYRL